MVIFIEELSITYHLSPITYSENIFFAIINYKTSPISFTFLKYILIISKVTKTD